MQWFAVMRNGVGKSVLLSIVPVQKNCPSPSVKSSLAIDFLRSRIAASMVASPLEHMVERVHAPAAAFVVKGESVKCTIAETLTASAEGSTGLNSSISCYEP